MKKIVRHIALPAIAPAAFFAVAATPVETFGCRNRGLLALCIVFIALLGAVVTTAIAVRRRFVGKGDHRRWLATSLVLLLPAVALLFLA